MITEVYINDSNNMVIVFDGGEIFLPGKAWLDAQTEETIDSIHKLLAE